MLPPCGVLTGGGWAYVVSFVSLVPTGFDFAVDGVKRAVNVNRLDVLAGGQGGVGILPFGPSAAFEVPAVTLSHWPPSPHVHLVGNFGVG